MKKNIKKFIGFNVLICIVFMLQFTVLASEAALSPSIDKIKEVIFEITSGLDTEKEKESTFDEQRTLTGTAEEGVLVSIQVSSSQEVSENLNESSSDENYDIVIGASGIFSQTIKLKVGENTIDITISKEGFETVKKSFIVNRKKREIMQELEKTIVLPGEKATPTIAKSVLDKSSLERSSLDSSDIQIKR